MAVEDTNMPLAFGALLVGALILEKGLSAAKAALTGGGTSTPSSGLAGGIGSAIIKGSSAVGAGIQLTNVPAKVAAMVNEADAIAARRLPYVWGGGHNQSFSPSGGTAGTGFDCSGAISAMLHAAGLESSPQVAAQFMSYGQAGKGQFVTIWAKATHVFMEVKTPTGSIFYGTSSQNPQGGAGWFKNASTAGFVPRHPVGL